MKESLKQMSLHIIIYIIAMYPVYVLVNLQDIEKLPFMASIVWLSTVSYMLGLIERN